ncbi:hypothetical protein FRB90_007930 [Tulasnella sp. 427]|nr:hypothetical protein FRB90_007930 [Tulasnella sp. 427]
MVRTFNQNLVTPSAINRKSQNPSLPMKEPTNRLHEERESNQVRPFRYKPNNIRRFKSPKGFLSFLQVDEKILPSDTPSSKDAVFSSSNFLMAVNTLSKLIRANHYQKSPTILFKKTESVAPGGHAIETQCAPDFVAAFENHFVDKTPLWPYIRLVGGIVSRGEPKDYQKGQAISYLHHLLLARPDLYVVQGMLTSPAGVVFFLGIWSVGWNSKKLLYQLMTAFIHRLYNPGDFADPSYQISGEPEQKHVKYTITITVDSEGQHQQIACPDFLPVYASKPFAARTHVFVNTQSTVKISGNELRVLKDQYCEKGARFTEKSILDKVHQDGNVPGVVSAVYHTVKQLPYHIGGRRKEQHRLGMTQCGLSFMAIPTVKAMLEISYDILEDISLKKGSSPSFCYNQKILMEVIYSKNPRETSAVLVDFNLAEELEPSKRGEQVSRAGTPVFIARAVQMGEPLPFPDDGLTLRPIAESPTQYAEAHPDRAHRFKCNPDYDNLPIPKPSENSERAAKFQWRHELDHDVESVFWLMLYWAICAQPKECRDGAEEREDDSEDCEDDAEEWEDSDEEDGHNTYEKTGVSGSRYSATSSDLYEKEPVSSTDLDQKNSRKVDVAIWALLTGNPSRRSALVQILDGSKLACNTLHSAFEPLMGLLGDLAHVLRLDQLWLNPEDPGKHEEYIIEVYQRLILQFILNNRAAAFMKLEVSGGPRALDGSWLDSSLNHDGVNISRRKTAEHRRNSSQGASQHISLSVAEEPEIASEDDQFEFNSKAGRKQAPADQSTTKKGHEALAAKSQAEKLSNELQIF